MGYEGNSRVTYSPHRSPGPHSDVEWISSISLSGLIRRLARSFCDSSDVLRAALGVKLNLLRRDPSHRAPTRVTLHCAMGDETNCARSLDKGRVAIIAFAPQGSVVVRQLDDDFPNDTPQIELSPLFLLAR